MRDVSILALSKASSDKVEFEKCDLNLLLAEMIANMDEEVLEKNVTILVEPIPPLFVSPALMRQLFQNLINNAIKYRSNEVALVIKISSRINAGNDYYNEAHNLNDCLIFVEDNGIGFDQKYSEEIFGILQKLHDSSEYEGAGIGLTLCRKITDLHHGFISARSIEHKGSVFTVSLPLFLEVAV